MTTKTFCLSGFRLRYPDIPLSPGQVQRGGLTVEYHDARERCIRRLRRILARKSEIQKWQKKYDAWDKKRMAIVADFVKTLREHDKKNPNREE